MYPFCIKSKSMMSSNKKQWKGWPSRVEICKLFICETTTDTFTRHAVKRIWRPAWGQTVGWVASFLHGCKIWLVGGWTNPSEKILLHLLRSQIGNLPQNRGEHKTYLKPPPRNALQIIGRLVITAPQTVAVIWFFHRAPGPINLKYIIWAN